MSDTDREKLFAFFGKYARVQAAITGAMGTASVVVAGPLMDVFGIQRNAASDLMFRAFGAGIVFVAVTHYGAKDTRDVAFIKTVATSNLVEDGILAVLSTMGTLNGTFGKAGWLLAGLFSAEVIAAIYVLSLARKAGTDSP